jgi:quinol-cytochrome oxidoreductase complex cytochrome b subunit
MKNSEKVPNKLILLFGISTSILFIILGIYLYTTKSIDPSYSNFRKIVGIACIVFFGINGLIGIKKLVSK